MKEQDLERNNRGQVKRLTFSKKKDTLIKLGKRMDGYKEKICR